MLAVVVGLWLCLFGGLLAVCLWFSRMELRKMKVEVPSVQVQYLDGHMDACESCTS
jgi:hypothetical protein